MLPCARILCCGCSMRNAGAHEAFVITLYSCIASFLFLVAGFVIGLETDSSSELSFAWENMLDLASSLVVLWRFSQEANLCKKQTKGKPLDPAMQHQLAVRERITSLTLSLSIICLSVLVGSMAILHLAMREQPRLSGIYRDEIGLEIYVSVPSAMVGSALGAIQIFIGGAMNSHSLTKDGLISVFGALTSLGAWIGATSDVLTDGASWYLDSTITLLLAITLFAYGCHAIWEEVWNPWPSAASIGETASLKTSPPIRGGTPV